MLLRLRTVQPLWRKTALFHSKNALRSPKDALDERDTLSQFGFDDDDLAELGLEDNYKLPIKLKPSLQHLKDKIQSDGNKSFHSNKPLALSLVDKFASLPFPLEIFQTKHFTLADSISLCLPKTLDNPAYKELLQLPSIHGLTERWSIVKARIQQLSTERIVFGCYPGGLIDFQDFRKTEVMNFHIHVFYDSEESLQRDKRMAIAFDIQEHVSYHDISTPDIHFKDQFNILTTNGADLFTDPSLTFFKKLLSFVKPGGTLMVSTSAPVQAQEVDNKEALEMDKIFFDLIEREVYSIAEAAGFLQDAGWEDVQTIEGTLGSYPTFVATKPKVDDD